MLDANSVTQRLNNYDKECYATLDIVKGIDRDVERIIDSVFQEVSDYNEYQLLKKVVFQRVIEKYSMWQV